jgi:hypothetical protein
VNCLGDAEISDDRVAVREQDVLRLDVAMHYVLGVRVGEGTRYVPQESRHVANRQPGLAYEAVPQRLAIDERHRVVQRAVRQRARRE